MSIMILSLQISAVLTGIRVNFIPDRQLDLFGYFNFILSWSMDSAVQGKSPAELELICEVISLPETITTRDNAPLAHGWTVDTAYDCETCMIPGNRSF
jgi:hypothetical protein